MHRQHIARSSHQPGASRDTSNNITRFALTMERIERGFTEQQQADAAAVLALPPDPRQLKLL